jgi:hypothetical protein
MKSMADRLPLEPVGRLLIAAGLVLALSGLILVAGSRLSFFRLGKLPGDIAYRGKNTTFYFPIVSSLVVSAALTLAVWLISRLTRH